jgi:hypothetical protein
MIPTDPPRDGVEGIAGGTARMCEGEAASGFKNCTVLTGTVHSVDVRSSLL